MGLFRTGPDAQIQRALKQEFERQEVGPLNERATEYGFVFRQIARQDPARILDTA